MASITSAYVALPELGFIPPNLERVPNLIYEVPNMDFSSTALVVSVPVPLAVAHTPSPFREHSLKNSPTHIKHHPPMSAARAPTFGDDVYNRLWFIPNPVDFGYILAATDRDFWVWNAYLDTDKTCVGVSYSDANQFSVAGPAPTFLLPALGIFEYEATAYAEGAFTFDVLSQWDFQDEILEGRFIGTRVVVLDFEPLYDTMKEGLEFATDMLSSSNGHEQRVQVRQLPRKSLSFEFFIPTERVQADWEAILFQWQKKAFGIPLWGEAEVHSPTITGGDTVINMDTRYAEFEVDGLAIIWQGRDKYEPIQISALTDSTLTTAFPITSTYTGTKHIIPVCPCYMSSQPTWTPTPDENAKVKVAFEGILPFDLPTTWTYPSTYETLPVLEDPSIVREKGLERKNLGEMTRVDYTTGYFATFSDTEFVREINKFRFRRETKEAVWELREMFYYLKGKQKTMLIPSYKKDFTVAQAEAIYGKTFIFEGILIYRNYYVNDLKKRMLFLNRDTGQREYVTITNMSSDGLTSTVVVGGSGVPWAVTPTNTLVCWLDRVRLVTDNVSFKWERLGEMELTCNFITVEQ